ncbi:MAG: FHA domain-containing protein, partial [Pseudomonadota bacterium]
MTSKNNSGGLVAELIWGEPAVGQPQRWSLDRPLLIGREHADIIIPVPAVSRRHAKIAVKTGYCTIEDLDSRNGTAVNGTLLPAGTQEPLRDGNIILLAGL